MKLIYFTILFIILLFSTIGNQINPMERMNDARDKELIFNANLEKSPPCIQVYYYTKYYCKIYNVPEWFAFRILKQETGYKGPSHLIYTNKQISIANALGPYQVLLSTGRDIHDDYFPLTKELLLSDIRLNTKLGVKYMAWLYSQYNNWRTVAGRYNSGKSEDQWPAETKRYVNEIMS